MSITARRDGEFSVCAYTGCWEGRTELVEARGRLLWAQDSATFSTRPEGGFEAWHVPAMLVFGVTTYLGFFSMMKANEVGTTGQVSVIGYCVPLFGVIGGVLVFGDAVTAALVIGGLMILVSVTLIGLGSGRRPST